MKEKLADEKKIKAVEKKLDGATEHDDDEEKGGDVAAPKAKAKGKAKAKVEKNAQGSKKRAKKDDDEAPSTPKKKLFQSDDEDGNQDLKSESPTLYLDPMTGEAKTLDQILEGYVPKKHEKSKPQPSRKKNAQIEEEMAKASKEVKAMKPDAKVMPEQAMKSRSKLNAAQKPKAKAKAKGKNKRKAAEEDEPEAMEVEVEDSDDEHPLEDEELCESEKVDDEELEGGRTAKPKARAKAKAKARAKAKAKAKAKARGKAKAKPANKRIQESPSVKKEKKRRKEKNDAMMELQPADMEDTMMQAIFMTHLKRTENLHEEETKDYLKCKVGDNFDMVAFSNYWKDKAVGVVKKADRSHLTYFGFGKSLTWTNGITLAFVSANLFVAGLSGWTLFALVMVIFHLFELHNFY